MELYNENEVKKNINKETEGVRQFFGNDTNVELLIARNETYPAITNMKSVKMIVLQLRALQKPEWRRDEMKQWEISVVHFFKYSFFCLTYLDDYTDIQTHTHKYIYIYIFRWINQLYAKNILHLKSLTLG